MGRKSYRYLESDCQSFSTKWLKDHKYFCGFKQGGITWNNTWGNNVSIGFSVHTMEDPKIHFRYSDNKGFSEREMDYSFRLLKIPCNLKGFRWAFECGLYKTGVFCGRPVHVLYRAGSGYFGCRHCLEITYDSQRYSGGRFYLLNKDLIAERKYFALNNTVYKRHYRGRPTKKIQRLLKLKESLLPLEEVEKLHQSLLKNNTIQVK